jgi:2-amino-4-hydroxy-6-hydroxymethyldihydropteridine diphosphokinase
MEEVLCSMSKCAIALGSNLGNSLDILENSLTALANIPGIAIKNTSSWYQTKPVGNIDPQPDYLNGCAVLEVAQNPTELLTLLQATEVQFGRVRRERWSARTLDLDLLLYDDLILDSPSLTIPHPRMHERAFVLVPLAEIAPNWLEPVSGVAIAKLLRSVDTSGVKPYVVG